MSDLVFKSAMDDSEYNRTLSLMSKRAEAESSKISAALGKAGKHGGGGGGQDFAWGVHDLAEGRTAFGLSRLASAAGLAGAAAAGSMVAFQAANAVIEKYSEGVNKLAEDSEHLAASLSKLNTEAIPRGSTAERTAAPEDSTIEGYKKQIAAERELQETLRNRYKGVGGFFTGLMEIPGAVLGGNPFVHQQQNRESEMRQEVAERGLSQVEKQKARNISFGNDAKDSSTSRQALQREVEEGNALYMAGENEKRRIREESAKLERDLDADNAMERIKNLRKEVEEGNSLYLTQQRERAQKEKADLKSFWIPKTERDLEAAGNRFQDATAQQHAFDMMSPDERRQSIRDQRHEERVSERRGRINGNPDVRETRPGSARMRNQVEMAAASVKALAEALGAELARIVVAP